MKFYIYLIIIDLIILLAIYLSFNPIELPCVCQEPAWFQRCSNTVKGSRECDILKKDSEKIGEDVSNIVVRVRNVANKLPELPPVIPEIKLPRTGRIDLGRVYRLDNVMDKLSYSCEFGEDLLGDLIGEVGKFLQDLAEKAPEEAAKMIDKAVDAALSGDINALAELYNSPNEMVRQKVQEIIGGANIPIVSELVKMGSVDAAKRLTEVSKNVPIVGTHLSYAIDALPLDKAAPVLGELTNMGNPQAALRLVNNYKRIPGANKIIGPAADAINKMGLKDLHTKAMKTIGLDAKNIPGAQDILGAVRDVGLLKELGSIGHLGSINKLADNLQIPGVSDALSSITDNIPIVGGGNVLKTMAKLGNPKAALKVIDNINVIPGVEVTQIIDFLPTDNILGQNAFNKALGIINGDMSNPFNERFVRNLTDISAISKLTGLGNITALNNLQKQITGGIPGAQEALNVLMNNPIASGFNNALKGLQNTWATGLLANRAMQFGGEALNTFLSMRSPRDIANMGRLAELGYRLAVDQIVDVAKGLGDAAKAAKDQIVNIANQGSELAQEALKDGLRKAGEAGKAIYNELQLNKVGKGFEDFGKEIGAKFEDIGGALDPTSW